MYDLAINLPIHNEGRSISKVIDEWDQRLASLNINYCLIFSEDGSKDNTKDVLLSYINKNKRYENNIVETRRGYSGAVISGVKLADSEFILCIDSDGQCDPGDFENFWKRRNDADVIMGYRNPRVDNNLRKIYSSMFKLYHRILFGKSLKDPSCPYVLFKKSYFSKLEKYLYFTLEGFWWGFVAGCKKIDSSIIELPVNHRVRMEGETQVYKISKIPSIALRNAIGLLKIKFMK